MRERKTYFLDLHTLLTYLNGQSCELTTELKVSGKIARGAIVLKEGKVVDCLLTLHNGSQVVGEKAYKQLEACDQWQVELENPEEKRKALPPVQYSPQPTRFLPTPPVPASNPWYPLRQKRLLDPTILQNMPMKQRFAAHSVYALINGRRSNEEIRTQLRLSPTDFDDALRSLRAFDLIE